MRNSFCSEHIGNKLELYCTKCQVNVCVVCLAIDHKGHDCQGIKAMYKSKCDALKGDIKNVAIIEASILQEISRLELAGQQRIGEFEQVEKELLKIADELKRRVDETVNQLIQKLSEDKKTASKVTSAAKDRLDMMLAEMRSFEAYSTELVDKGRPCDVTQAYKDLHSRAETLLKYDLKMVSCNLPEVDTNAREFLNKLSEVIIPLGELW
jgi:hypothetical protein